MRPVRLVLLVVLALAACGASQRERTVKATLAAVNETRDAFIVFDRTVQQTIVDTAPTYERGDAALLRYRVKRVRVVDAFALAYRAISIAATVNDDPSVATMAAAARAVADAWRLLKEGDHAP